MNVKTHPGPGDRAFVARLEELTGQQFSLCYQCGNCTAGCPCSFAYDMPVHKIMRLVQTGRKNEVLSCRSVWLCASCNSCSVRCPNKIDVARIMDVLRHMARQEGHAPEHAVKAFTDSFLASVEHNGRAFEMGILAGYAARTGRFWTGMDLAPKLLPKGKLSPLPHKVKNPGAIARIFERFREELGK